MKMFLYIATFIGGILGIFILFGSLVAESAPQQGAGAAVAIAFVVIPYCMARVLEKARQEPLAEALAKALLAQRQFSQPPQPQPPAPTPAAHAPNRRPFAAP